MAQEADRTNTGIIQSFNDEGDKWWLAPLGVDCEKIKNNRQRRNDDWLEAAMKIILQRHGDCVQVASDQLGEDLWQCRGHSWNMGPCTPDQILTVWEKWTAAVVKCGTDAAEARVPWQEEWLTINTAILNDYRLCCEAYPASCGQAPLERQE